MLRNHLAAYVLYQHLVRVSRYGPARMAAINIDLVTYSTYLELDPIMWLEQINISSLTQKFD